MAIAQFVLRAALSGVFVSSALGKLVGKKSLGETALCVLELVLALGLWFLPWSVAAGAVALALSIAYVVYAFTRLPTERCRCFGSRLPSTGRAGQRLRNLLLLLTAAGYLVAVLFSSGAATAYPLAGWATGLLIAGALVAGPWVFEWAMRPSRMTS